MLSSVDIDFSNSNLSANTPFSSSSHLYLTLPSFLSSSYSPLLSYIDNTVLINKLEQITNGLRLIHKKIDAHGDWDDAYAVTQQMGSVLEAVVDVVSRLEHPDHVREPKSM